MEVAGLTHPSGSSLGWGWRARGDGWLWSLLVRLTAERTVTDLRRRRITHGLAGLEFLLPRQDWCGLTLAAGLKRDRGRDKLRMRGEMGS